MKKKILIVVSMLFSTLPFFSQPVPSVSSENYFIKIADPISDGFKVGRTYKLTGTAQVPEGFFLYALCHRSDLGLWWPQSQARIDPVKGEWKVTVSFGEARDIGEDFEIVLIAVDKTVLAQLNAAIVANSGVTLPDGKLSALRVVNKISH